MPRVVFREQADASLPIHRRGPVLSGARLNRLALRGAIGLVALAATFVGLQKVLQAAPGYLDDFASSVVIQGSKVTND